MNITIGGWIGFLIGLGFGGISCLLVGIIWTDEHWRKKMNSVWCKKEAEQAPYEIEKKE